MQIRRSSLALLFWLFAGPFVVCAADPSPIEAVHAMSESERKFYQTGQKKGTRAAFLEFLADDGIVFRPGPVNGKEVWSKRPETGLDLIWEPTLSVIARSGDFGYTTGPAKWRANKKEGKFLGYGQFVSIWKKQSDGSWKVALDCGIENPKPAEECNPPEWSVPKENLPIDLDLRRKGLQAAQQRFIDAAKGNSSEAILGSAADQIRVYRDGSFPAGGKDANRPLFNSKSGKMTFEAMGGDMSRSADLAYSYGKYSVTRNETSESGHFFQIWQTDTTAVWKIVVDWQQPLPKEEPATK